MTTEVATPWWVRPGLEVRDDRLTIAGHDAEAIAREHGTPVYVYDLDRFAENMRGLQAALAATGLPYVARFAMKAHREPEVLAELRALGDVGIDACSPGEVRHALANGWRPDEISYTGTNVSDRDFAVLLEAGVHVNLDAVSQVARFGRLAPGSSVGFRVNTGFGAGYNEVLSYSGVRPTKFGIWPDRLEEALAVAREHRLTVDTLHFHAGSGWLRDGLAAFEDALVSAVRMTRLLLDQGCPLREVNVGGGLGKPARDDEPPVDLDAYAAVLARHLGPLGVTIACEPGDYVTKDAGVILGEVVTVERRGGTVFVGLDFGWNVNNAYFIYRYLQELVPVRSPLRARTEVVTVAGHINEAGDVFAEDYPMAPVAEGEIVALLNGGGYHQAMASTHCMRPVAPAVFLRRAR